MENHVCQQRNKEEGIGKTKKKIVRNIHNPPTTKEIDNMTHAEIVKALKQRATLLRREHKLQRATIIELTRRDRANQLTIRKLKAEIAEQKQQIKSHGISQK